MPQITIYLDRETEQRARRAAESAGLQLDCSGRREDLRKVIPSPGTPDQAVDRIYEVAPTFPANHVQSTATPSFFSVGAVVARWRASTADSEHGNDGRRR